jgi:hypothetical protein
MKVFPYHSELFAWGWLQTEILLISASWVARITVMSHQHLGFQLLSSMFFGLHCTGLSPLYLDLFLGIYIFETIMNEIVFLIFFSVCYWYIENILDFYVDFVWNMNCRVIYLKSLWFFKWRCSYWVPKVLVYFHLPLGILFYFAQKWIVQSICAGIFSIVSLVIDF